MLNTSVPMRTFANLLASVLFAMILIWSCWLPFESGTALALNFKAVMAFVVANMAAAAGALTWILTTCTSPSTLEFLRTSKTDASLVSSP